MRALTYDLETGRTIFRHALTGFLAAAESLSDLDLLDPARCRGWSRLDVIVHVRMGVDELVAPSASPVDSAPTHNAASSNDGPPDDRYDDPVPHILWLRRTAAAYRTPAGAVRHLSDVIGRARATC